MKLTKIAFYPRLALDGLRKNRRLVLPYILTCIGMVTMRYIMAFLSHSPAIERLPGGFFLGEMMNMGVGVLTIFACIFLFYTNSFLMRRRKREYGLYNVLGMGKGNLGFIFFWETLFIALLSLGVGLGLGAAFSKLAELGLVNIMGGEADYTLSLSPQAALTTAWSFTVTFALLFLNGLRQIGFSSTISLLRSENAGEKPPRGNWLLGLLGAGLLGVAYYIALTIGDPVAALAMFFLAVLLVILGTYLLLIAGSVVFCRLLQKNKRYYYKPSHFVSVSSMVYRMKRNGAGLASICVLATMVLVMISSTASLYIGGEDSLLTRYPREINLCFRSRDVEDLSPAAVDALRQETQTVAARYGSELNELVAYRSVAFAGIIDGDVVDPNMLQGNWGFEDLSGLYQFYFVPLEDYNAMTEENETLEDGEALLYAYRGSYKNDAIIFAQGPHFRIKRILTDFPIDGDAAMSAIPTMLLVVPDLGTAVQGLDRLADFNGDRLLHFRFVYNFDTGLDEESQAALYTALRKEVCNPETYESYGLRSVSLESRTLNRDEFYSLYGGLFYLGILLSIVFLFAAVLIIYYKQISEGYEDQARFAIMQKVGMTRQAIRKSINSQLLTVFFFPLLLASCHLAFAFPIVQKLLLLFNFNNTALFAQTTVGCVVVFGVFYTVVYRITSNAYYGIVSTAE